MGEPILEAERIPTTLPATQVSYMSLTDAHPLAMPAHTWLMVMTDSRGIEIQKKITMQSVL